MPVKLHENILRLRHAAELTAEQAAKRVQMDRITWSDIERGKNPNPTAKTLERIAKALGVTVAELWVDEDGEAVTL